MLRKDKIRPATGKLAILTPGIGAVATTFMAGVLSIRKGLAKPYGSVTQMATIRLGKRTEANSPLIKDFLPLATLDQLVFGGWDIFPENAYDAAVKAEVLRREHLDQVKAELSAIKPMPAVFDTAFVKRIDGPNKKTGSKWEKAQALREDIRNFMKQHGCSRAVVVWCASTEAYSTPIGVHASLAAFEEGLKKNDPAIAPSQIYAYAALSEKIPFANGAPNLCLETGAMRELARKNQMPIGGKDFKTGQTLMKTILAPGFKSRMLGVSGWFSTNILGNRDGEVLDDPESFKSKEVSKLGVLDTVLQPDVYPDLYKNLYHKIRINYYPPRGDNKESWDNIDIFGWLNYPMQIKVNFLCRDSILAAPIVLDLALLMDLAQRANMFGIQEWLSFYWKSPQVAEGLYPEHDLFIQQIKLKNTMRWLMREDLITHLGLEYYDMLEGQEA
ncbi:MAG: inositol-3-phosphate synthase [Myxococcales bacterium]|nr:MAG: inositol-3-phosphate synthase [Myxococcales bacterium]